MCIRDRVNVSYLELPVMVAARFAMDRNTHILVAAGPYGAWGIGGKTVSYTHLDVYKRQG